MDEKRALIAKITILNAISLVINVKTFCILCIPGLVVPSQNGRQCQNRNLHTYRTFGVESLFSLLVGTAHTVLILVSILAIGACSTAPDVSTRTRTPRRTQFAYLVTDPSITGPGFGTFQ